MSSDPTNPKATELAQLIATRRANDAKWAQRNFMVAQTFMWLAIIASFGTAIASATAKVSPIVIAIFTAIPGTVILIDKSFSFARRAQWHYLMRAKLEQFENALRFEGASVDATSKSLSSLVIEMEQAFPGMDSTGLADHIKKLE